MYINLVLDYDWSNEEMEQSSVPVLGCPATQRFH